MWITWEIQTKISHSSVGFSSSNHLGGSNPEPPKIATNFQLDPIINTINLSLFFSMNETKLNYQADCNGKDAKLSKLCPLQPHISCMLPLSTRYTREQTGNSLVLQAIFPLFSLTTQLNSARTIPLFFLCWKKEK